MSEHHLSWPEEPHSGPLAILLDLFGRWNTQFRFQVNVRLSPFRVESNKPELKFVPRAPFRSWIATMRLLIGKFTESTQSLHYEWYLRGMPRLFDVPASRSSKIISSIKGMNKLTLDMLVPAMTAPESRIVRMPMCDLTETAIPLFATGRLVLLLKEYLMWARRFSPEDIVEVENVCLCRFVVRILGLGVETQQTLKVIPGLRVTYELGWKAHNEMADVTLRIAGLLQSAHARHCLVEIENAEGIEWLSVFLIRLAPENFIRDIRDVLINSVCFEVNYSFSSVPRAPASRGTVIVLWLVFCQNRHGELVFFSTG
ncbi:hypothetical protein MRX96_058069 [Rhipicephalus microplus]